MNRKKIFIITLILIVIFLLIFVIFHNISITKNDANEISEYTPQEEINNVQLRTTTISLYFLNPETSNLEPEGRLIDSSFLLDNPYKYIVEQLINGPINENLKNVFPENTKILNATLNNNCVVLDFSEEISKYVDETQKYNIINSILNSLSQLNEVNSIKITINNSPANGMEREYVIN